MIQLIDNDENESQLCPEHYYHDICVTEFNIHFGFPRPDTCERCDSLKLRIEAATEEDRQKLEMELNPTTLPYIAIFSLFIILQGKFQGYGKPQYDKYRLILIRR